MIATAAIPRNAWGRVNVNRSTNFFAADARPASRTGSDGDGRSNDSATTDGFVVAIGGFDPTGGAGLVRDFLTARTLGAGVRLIPTAWTDQSPAGVRAVEPRGPAALADAIAFARNSRVEPAAVKVGMVPTTDSVAAIVGALEGFEGPVVVDPVLAASSGGPLFDGTPADLMPLLARATLVTPNAHEATRLTGVSVDGPLAAAAAGRALCGAGAQAVLIKGGHWAGPEAVDVLVAAGRRTPVERQFSGPRLAGPPVRGTGCALATAIAVGLSRGLSLASAIAGAKDWLAGALAHPLKAGGEWHLS